MVVVPWWVLLSSACAPVALIGGWVLAAALQPAGYDPMVQSISSLAAQGAADRWLMTSALFVLGFCHMTTALGLRTAAGPGRVALGCGGVASVAVALSPEPAGGTSLSHLVSTGVGFTAVALWPVIAAMRGAATTWALKPATGYVATALIAVGAVWFLVELHGHGAAGLAERVLTGAQSTWPLIVVVACVSSGLRTPVRRVPAAAMARRERSDSER